MIYCEECRVKKMLNRPATFPYHDHGQAKCDICKRRKDCYDYPGLYVKPKQSWTSEEILLDNILQQEYHKKADSLIIAYISVPGYAGASDNQQTEELRNVIVKIDNQIDWFATYKLRQRVQDGHRKADELNRNRR
jgi:hypothetical protein